MGFQINATQCPTCIYRKVHPVTKKPTDWDVKELERQIADPHMDGYFKGYRICHQATNASGVCCWGFWNRHKNHFTMGQLAQRLGWVRFVKVEGRLKRRT